MIDKSANGLAEFFLDKINEVDQSADIDIRDKIKLAKAASQEVRELMKLNLQYKNLMLKAPDVARNQNINLQLGKPN